MEIVINNSIDKPIYKQIVSQIQADIISGNMHKGEPLPSMRLLAKDLQVSVITTKRAYDELEKDGFIISFTGRGTFVAETNLELIKENSLKQIEEYFNAAIDIAKKVDVTKDEMAELISLLYVEKPVQ